MARSPSFQKPPVVETVMGVQFEPLTKLTSGHLGAFWLAMGGKAAWPTVSEAPPLGQEFERFSDEKWGPMGRTASLQLLTQMPTPRLQFTSAAGDAVLQLQNGRLFYNWIGTRGASYPRYETLRPKFEGVYSAFSEFAAREGLGPVRPNQWEISYINHLPRGTLWNTPSDWNQVFSSPVMLPADLGDCQLETFGGRWAYEIAPKRGRLHVELRHGMDTPNGTELLIFTLTARGPVLEGPAAVGNPFDGLDLGHNVITRAFAALTSSLARDYWEQIQ